MQRHAAPRTNASTQVIVVHGPAGGVGKTTIALHLAYLYAGRGLQTVLLDLSQYGTIAPWLRLHRGTGSNLISLLTSGQGEAALRELVPAPEGAQNLHLVLSSGPARMDRLTATDVEGMIQYLCNAVHTVIVDTGSELTERTLGALLTATHLALTITPAVTAGWQALDFLEILRSVYVPRERMGLVFSRVRPGNPYGLDEYAQALGLPVWGVIPENRQLHAAAAQGGAPNVNANHHGLRAIRRLAHQMVPIFRPEELKRSWPWKR